MTSHPLLYRALVGVLLALLLVGVAPAMVYAQDPLSVRIREATLQESGEVELVVSVTGPAVSDDVLGADAFTVTEQGEGVSGLAVDPLIETQAEPVSVALLLDVSGSTQGEPLDNAKQAAGTFVEGLAGEGVQVGLIAFGGSVVLDTGFSTDASTLNSAIAGLEASGETALYDAIVHASEALSQSEGQHNVVVFSDGGDTVSQASLQEAIAAAQSVEAPVTSVALQTPELDPQALDDLAAETGGRTVPVGDAAQLGSAFGQVARDIASQYVLTYTGSASDPDELDIAVAVAVEDASVTDTVTVINPRAAPPLPVELEEFVPQPVIGVFAGQRGLYVGIGTAFLATLLLLSVMLWRTGRGRAAKVLQKGVHFYSPGEDRKPEDLSLSLGDMSRRAANLLEGLPKPAGFEERTQERLDRAAWPMRASEFLLLVVGAAIGGAVLGYALSGNILLALLLSVVGGGVPNVVLSRRIETRQSDFGEQLPDTLQLLAGSLQAGYAMLQAIDTVAKEAPEPTSSEFRRVVTEARLGMPLEDALDGMAERVGSEDFQWVVMAINIQRQVGGNLAELLHTVAETLRERFQVRRHIKTLSAEGRLSAAVLIALPFLMAAYLLVVNPDYLAPLITSTVGLAMIVFGLVFMAIGVVWIRKIIDIEV